jgi:myo-inositol 2-dehydrogenase / D-chiro-inositol 1-dehydrogenase
MQAPDRRQFIAAAAATTAAGIVGNAFAGGSDEMRVGLIGCGGRGTGAAENVLESAPGVRIVALADVFKDKAYNVRSHLSDWVKKDGLAKELGNNVDIPDEKMFDGFDAFQRLLETDANYIMLATPPGFRPMHLQAAVAAGKHIFTEKPVAVDGPGIRKVFGLIPETKRKNLCIAAGTQRRHNAGYIATMKQVHDGAIGDIVAMRCYWNNSGIWFHERQKGMSDVVYQLYNWYHFLWICGDHIVEQHVHNLDVCNWAMKAHPVRCDGAGGRTPGNPCRPTGPPEDAGQIFDNFSIDYEYPGGVHMYSSCRHLPPCKSNVSETIVGTKGTCHADRFTINGKRVAFESDKRRGDYTQEHTDLIESIRSGKPINELQNVTESTLTAIMGRTSAYTGKAVTWDEALNSPEDTFPKTLDLNGKLAVSPVPSPCAGKTR